MKYLKYLKYLIMLLVMSGSFLSAQTIKIMPLGNSMTEGWMDGSETPAQRRAYRYDLKNLLTTAGYTIDFVGSESTGCEYFTDCQNAGISGTRDQYLEEMLRTGFDRRWFVQKTPGYYLDAFSPDIILLSIGTNDITHEPDCIVNEKVSGILNQIDQYEARSGKEVIVFLALIINRRLTVGGGQPTNFYTTHQWNLAIESMAQQRIANGDKIVIVDMEEEAGINYAYYGGDMCVTDTEGLHPSSLGYSKMASLWYQKFIDNFNMAPAITTIPDQMINEGDNFNSIVLDNYVHDIEDSDKDITWTFTQLVNNNLNININANREVVITPKDPNWSGTQTVVFTATDNGQGNAPVKSDRDTVVLSITAVNDPPNITSQQTLSMNEDTPLTLHLSDFTIEDPDNIPAVFELVILSGENYSYNGTIITPAPDFSGNLSVKIAVRDASDQGPVFQALVSVTAVNDPPVFIAQPEIVINEDETYILDLQNFTVIDPDNALPQLTLVVLPGINYVADGSTITPDQNYSGTIYVESYILDPLGGESAVFYIQMDVSAVNDVPQFSSTPIDSAELLKQYIYAFAASDPDGDPLVYTVESKPDWMTFYSNSRLIAGIPPASALYNNNISLSVTDGHSTVLQTFVLHVKGGVTPVGSIGNVEFNLYPNPAKEYVNIEFGDYSDGVIFTLYNLNGKVLMSKLITSVEPQIMFNGELKSGTYLYSLQLTEQIIKGKLIIQE